MNRIAALLVLCLCGMGVACQTTKAPPIQVQKLVATKIPPELLKCPGVDWPKSETLTDKQVAKLLVQLNSAYKTCKISIESIKKWEVEVARELSQR